MGVRGRDPLRKLLEEIEPDQVHILVDGQIVQFGRPRARPADRARAATTPGDRSGCDLSFDRRRRVRADIPTIHSSDPRSSDHLPRLRGVLGRHRARSSTP